MFARAVVAFLVLSVAVSLVLLGGLSRINHGRY
jgi:hypothetical protein